MRLPPMATVKQHFNREKIDNIPELIEARLAPILREKVTAGQKIGLTAGSRGITNIVQILKSTVSLLVQTGAHPVLIPSMGSHGGGTSDGQLAVLKNLGITTDSTGAPIIAETEAELIGHTSGGTPVFVNKAALNCDAILVINRVKPHTSFHGPVESGIHKMIAVGLGGPAGATALHKAGATALPEVIPAVARVIMGQINIIAGMAIVENAYEETAAITAMPPDKFWDKETSLLLQARRNMPSLPLDDIDLLIVDRMGKNFSGTGMDTNIIGRLRVHGLPEPSRPRIKRIVVLDLSPETNGNANGIGLADFTTRKLLGKIDFAVTYNNVLTSTFVQRAMLPVTLPSDREAISAALASLGLTEPDAARVIRIKNTLELAEIQVSTAVLDEVLRNPRVELVKEPQELQFDCRDNLKPF